MNESIHLNESAKYKRIRGMTSDDPLLSVSMQPVYEIMDASIRSTVLKVCNHFWRRPFESTTFPGAHPVTIQRRYLGKLVNQDYCVCEKTDGVRYIMVCLTLPLPPCPIQEAIGEHVDPSIPMQHVVVFVNRACRMFLVPVCLRNDLFQGSIFDGELVVDHDGKSFVIFDTIAYRGHDMTRMRLFERMHCAKEMVQKHWLDSTQQAIRLRIKDFVPFKWLERFVTQQLPTISKYQNVDGLIFTPTSLPVESGRQETLFKWKAKQDNTVDFVLQQSSTTIGLYELYVWDHQSQTNVFIGTTFPHNPAIDRTVFHIEHNMFHICNGRPCIVECYFSQALNRWLARSIRNDKSVPNDRATYERTVHSIEENIQMLEFLQLRTFA